jgi:hypothetical protein
MKNILFILVLFSTAIYAQDDARTLEGGDKPLFTQGASESPQCFVYGKYVVKTSPDTANGGETVMAYSRIGDNPPEESCRTKGQPIVSLTGNYSGKNTSINEDINSRFQGIFGKYLFIDKIVEPFQGAFEIFDLTSGKSVYKAENYPTLKLMQNRFVFYENWSVKDGLTKNCKEAKKWKKQGLGVGWVVKNQLDLQTFKVKKLGLRCEATQ